MACLIESRNSSDIPPPLLMIICIISSISSFVRTTSAYALAPFSTSAMVRSVGHLALTAPKSCRIAVVISGKVHKRAVVRNRLRRLLHDHLRTRFEARPEHGQCWLLISLRPGADAGEANLLEECDRLLEQAGLQP